MRTHAIAVLATVLSLPGAARGGALEDCAVRVRDDVRRKVQGGLDPIRGDIELQQRIITECLQDRTHMDDGLAMFLGALNFEFHRMAVAFVSNVLDSSAYLGLLRDREHKRDRGQQDPVYVFWFNRGDADGDFVPDKFDKCRGTPPGTVTDDNGCTDKKHARPHAPEDRLVRLGLSHYHIPVNSHCTSGAVPKIPEGIKFGYNNVDRKTFKLAVRRAPRTANECPIFYEFGVAIHTIQFGSKIEETANFVFQDTTDIEPGNPARAVFVIPETAVGMKGRVYGKYKYLNGATWRVRAVTAHGIPSAWSPSLYAIAPSFGEP